jgi:hypothetical protein
MKTAKLLCLGVLGAAAVVAAGEAAAAPKKHFKLGKTINLGCAIASGGDVVNTYTIKNTSGATIPKGRAIDWKTSAGPKGAVHKGRHNLEKDLGAGATVDVIANWLSGKECTASFNAGLPDLSPVSASFEGGGKVKVTIKNLNPWVDAPPAVTRIETMDCSHIGKAVEAVSSSASAVGAGKSIVVTVDAKNVPGGYLRATADATNKVIEGDEKNNVLDQASSCIK